MSDNTLKKDCLAESINEKSPLFDIIERLLKGVEIELPKQPKRYSFKDKDGKERYQIRVKWWGDRGLSYKKLAFGYGATA